MYEEPDMMILSLYLKSPRASMPCFMATNSVPKTDVTTVDCFFDYHCTKVLFMHIKKLLLDMQDILLHA